MLKNAYTYTGLLLLLFSWLFVGYYADEEFGDINFFFKHRPTTKVFFYYPHAMSDLKMEELSIESQEEVKAYKKYVYAHLIRKNIPAEPWLIVALQQATLSFLFLGIFNSKLKGRNKIRLLPIHFFSSFIFLFAGYFGMFALNEIVFTLLIIAGILIANYFILRLLIIKKSAGTAIPAS